MRGEFLERAHSKRLGELERSNWKILESENDFGRIDPAIRDIVSILNRKGYTTFSSCSGGHRTNPRWRVNRHESGYLAFSPPSDVPFKLYFSLRRKNRDFACEAQVVVDNGDGGGRETICTRIYWQLFDDKKPKTEYYEKLFAQMRKVVEKLPHAPVDDGKMLKSLMGPNYHAGSRIVNRQMKRFSSS